MPLFKRPDGVVCTDVPAVRRIMPFLMKGRNEAAVYFEQQIDLTKTLVFIDQFNARNPERKVSVFHVFLWAAVRALEARPRLNRFVVGSHIYQRDGIWVSYSAKKALTNDAPIVVLKRRFDPTLSFDGLVDFVYRDLREGRSDKQSHVDKELGLFLKIPAIVLRAGVALVRWLDTWNLLPGSFIHPDPMYASIFIANLGSLKIESAYHHLYEYGNIPFFAALGKKKQVITPDGLKTVCSVKYTFDERVEDGLYCAGALDVVQQLVEDPTAAIS